MCYLEANPVEFNAILRTNFPEPEDSEIKLLIKCRIEREFPSREVRRVDFLDFGFLVAPEIAFDYPADKLYGVSYGLKPNGLRWDGFENCEGRVLFDRMSSRGNELDDVHFRIASAANDLPDCDPTKISIPEKPNDEN